MVNKSYHEIVESIRQQCLEKGLSGIKGLAVMFRRMDRDYSKTLTFNELRHGIKVYQIRISEEQLQIVFRHLDKDRNNCVDFQEFLLALSPPMTKQRKDVIQEAFNKLDANKDGIIKLDELKGKLNRFS